MSRAEPKDDQNSTESPGNLHADHIQASSPNSESIQKSSVSDLMFPLLTERVL